MNLHPQFSRDSASVSESSPAAQSVYSHARTPTAPQDCHSQVLLSQTNVSSSEAAEINPAQVLAETAALESYFQDGFGQGMNNNEGEETRESDDDDEGVISGNEDSESDLLIVDNPKTRPALAWADKFILEMRRKGGRQTENSVLKLWKVCRKLLLTLQKFLGLTLYLFRHGRLMR